MTVGPRFCPRCGASLGRQARYCGHCGRAAGGHRRTQGAPSLAEQSDDRRRARAIAIVFVGVLAALSAVAATELDDAGAVAALAAGELAVGAAACAALGRRSWRALLGRAGSVAEHALAVPVATATLAVSFAWVRIIAGDAGGTGVDSWVLSAVVAALTEEWLCRGVLWYAIRPVTSRATAIVATAVLFAFLHGLNGGYLLELPHRFAGGLALGWLRARTGALGPCVLAHLLHNGVAVLAEP